MRLLTSLTGPMAVVATSVMALSAHAQTTTGSLAFSGNLINGVDFYQSPGGTNSGPALSFTVTVADVSALSITFPAPFPFRDSIELYQAGIDTTDPSRPTNGRIHGFDGFGNGGSTIGSAFFTSRVADGDVITFIVLCPGSCTGDLSFAMVINGVVVPFTGPSELEELAAMIEGVGAAVRFVVVDAGGVVQRGADASRVARDAAESFSRLADGSVTMSSQGAAGLAGGVYSWAEVTGFRSTERNDGAEVINGTGLAIGADIAVGANMIVGASIGFSEINASDTGFSQSGEFVYFQPYLSYQSGALQGDASLIFGSGSFDQTSTGGTGTADVTLTALTFEGGYDMALDGGFVVTPTIGLAHGREEVTGTSGTLTTTGSSTFSQFSLGSRVEYTGTIGAVFAGLHADYLTQDAGQGIAANVFSDEGWTGRVEVGSTTDMGHGLGLATSVELSGLGGNAQTVSGGVRMAFTF